MNVCGFSSLSLSLSLSVLLTVSAALPPILVYGAPWKIASGGPQILTTTARDVIMTFKWYIARDVGVHLFPLAIVGFAVGLSSKIYRHKALILLIAIASVLLYIADWYEKTDEDTARYVIATVPFTLLALGFLWKRGERRLGQLRVMPIVLSLLGIFYAGAVFLGVSSPWSLSLAETSAGQKIALFPYIQASSYSGIIQNAESAVLDFAGVARAFPDETTVLIPVSDWSASRFFFDVGGSYGRTIVTVEKDAHDLWRRTVEKADAEFVLISSGLDIDSVEEILEGLGYVPTGRISSWRVYRKLSEEPTAKDR